MALIFNKNHLLTQINNFYPTDVQYEFLEKSLSPQKKRKVLTRENTENCKL